VQNAAKSAVELLPSSAGSQCLTLSAELVKTDPHHQLHQRKAATSWRQITGPNSW